MQEAVSAILIGRSREVDGTLAHGDDLARRARRARRAGLVLPPGWFLSEPAERVVPMTISMGGVPGRIRAG